MCRAIAAVGVSRVTEAAVAIHATHAEGFVEWGEAVRAERRVLLTDAMTSGGLLISVEPSAADTLNGIEMGEIVPGTPGVISVH